MRNDAAFYTNQTDIEIVWQEETCDYYVVRSGVMRIHATKDDKHIEVIRYTDQLEAFGITTDSELEEWSKKDEEIFSWVNNSWFEILNDNDSEFYSEPIHDLSEAVELAKTMEKEKGKGENKMEETKKIFWNEMSESDMKKFGVEYWACQNCNYTPLVWQTAADDAKCESCGTWQNDILPDGLTVSEIELWYHEKGKGK